VRRRRGGHSVHTQERLRLSHDLHDNLQQLLAATMFRLDAAQSFFDVNRAAARELGGTFVVKSEPGKGTVVIVEIPV